MHKEVPMTTEKFINDSLQDDVIRKGLVFSITQVRVTHQQLCWEKNIRGPLSAGKNTSIISKCVQNIIALK